LTTTPRRRDGLDSERRIRLNALAGREQRSGDHRHRLHARLGAAALRHAGHTDGFGGSDTRAALRRFFEVDRWHVAIAALKALADEGNFSHDKLRAAIVQYGIKADNGNPWER
jgi:pyruvate dehydrogenase complex dehydrogenase (E1) component